MHSKIHGCCLAITMYSILHNPMSTKISQRLHIYTNLSPLFFLLSPLLLPRHGTLLPIPKEGTSVEGTDRRYVLHYRVLYIAVYPTISGDSGEDMINRSLQGVAKCAP